MKLQHQTHSTLCSTSIPELGQAEQGKVRDIYRLDDKRLILIATDRISIFDRVLNQTIRDKGKTLNLLAEFWLNQTQDIIANHMLDVPDPNVMVVQFCRPLPIEVVVRGYIAGSMWRDYAKGKRVKCGISLPDNLKKHDPLPEPIISPSTKNRLGHDLDISEQELVKKGIVAKELWKEIADKAIRLFQRGTERMQSNGIILVDTKYEFGIDDSGNLMLIDEIHTPDSSRFWFANDQAKSFRDKEYLREWSMQNSFMGDGRIPDIPTDVQENMRSGYLKLYQAMTNTSIPNTSESIHDRLYKNLTNKNLIQGRCIIIFAQKSKHSIKSMCRLFKKHHIPFFIHPYSEEFISKLNRSIEPLVCIDLDQRYNGGLKWPVLSSGLKYSMNETALSAIQLINTMEIPI